MSRVLVLDNGGSHVKAALVGTSSASDETRPVRELMIPNALARVGKSALSFPQSAIGSSRRPSGMLVGAEMEDAPDFGGMVVRRPHERGVVTCWDAQRDVWLSLMSADRGLGLDGDARADTALLLTEAPGMPLRARTASDELVFEEFGFASCAVAPAARLVAATEGDRGGRALVVDSGFSFSHAVPIDGGWELAQCARRLSVGGKALTNHLKATVSYRSWNMMDETVVINAVKERLCYVSLDFPRELDTARDARSPARADYILPDLSTIGADRLGRVRVDGDLIDTDAQVLVMNNERFSIPELIFNPSDAGVQQAGLAETIFQAVESAPEHLRAYLYHNIVLVGGNCLFENFQTRLMHELRPLVGYMYDVNIKTCADPIRAAMRAGVQTVLSEEEPPYRVITKKEYEEEGSFAIASKYFYNDT